MNKSIFIPLLASFIAVSMALTQFTPAYALHYPAEINKSFSPIAIVSGGTSKLRVTIYNPNSNPLTNASWTDTLPTGISFVTPLNLTHTCGTTATVTAAAGVLTLSNGTVPEQVGSVIGRCYVEVDVTSITPGNLINTIPSGALSSSTLDGTETFSITNTTPASATLNVIGVQPPSLSKSFNPNTISVGQTSTLTITITNNDANNPLTQTTLTDVLPTGVILANPVQHLPDPILNGCGEPTARLLNGTGGTPIVPGNSTLTLDNGTIAKNSNCVITVDVTSLAQGAYTNTIPVGSGTPGSPIHTREGVTNASAASDQLNVQAFDLHKYFGDGTGTPTIAVGDLIDMTIKIDNIANIPYENVQLTDTLPSTTLLGGSAINALEYDTVSAPTFTDCGVPTSNFSTVAPATGAHPNNMVLSSISIASNSTCTITVKVRANMDSPAATFRNTIPIGAVVTGDGAINHAPASGDLIVRSLSIYKAFWLTTEPVPPVSGAPATPTFAAGQTSNVTIWLSNPSPDPFNIVSISDTLPSTPNNDLIYSGVPTTDCGAGTAALSGSPLKTVTLTGGTIPAGTIATPGLCRIVAQVTTSASSLGGTYTNTVVTNSLSTSEGGLFPTPSNSANVNVTTLTVNKSYASGAAVYPIGKLLTIRINNPATGGALTGITFTDNLDSRLEIVDLTSTPASPNPTTTCNATTTPQH